VFVLDRSGGTEAWTRGPAGPDTSTRNGGGAGSGPVAHSTRHSRSPTGGRLDSAQEAELRIGGHSVATVDTVGAGDAFCGSLAASLAAGASLADAVRLANAAGALSTTVNGAAASAPARSAAQALLDAQPVEQSPSPVGPPPA
jgi:ribokinase